MIETLKQVHTYLKKLNQQFDGKLIEQEELDDLLDNINDLYSESEILSKSAQRLNKLSEFSKNWEELTTINRQELSDEVEIYQQVLEMHTTLQNTFEAVEKVGVNQNSLLDIPIDDEDFYDFGKANVAYEVEGNEEMEMVSKEGMEELRQELFQLRKYQYEKELEKKTTVDSEELEAFRVWKKQQSK